ncbi:hypothetical protein VTK73DRAFT_9465 [Phialemonium thermophilum]|uniref:Uncharacterized protein n=1 Tax=Phialemonium thermophilum TaxID=223376 RepID=A0ABR3W228_9PEZI
MRICLGQGRYKVALARAAISWLGATDLGPEAFSVPGWARARAWVVPWMPSEGAGSKTNTQSPSLRHELTNWNTRHPLRSAFVTVPDCTGLCVESIQTCPGVRGFTYRILARCTEFGLSYVEIWARHSLVENIRVHLAVLHHAHHDVLPSQDTLRAMGPRCARWAPLRLRWPMEARRLLVGLLGSSNTVPHN